MEEMGSVRCSVGVFGGEVVYEGYEGGEDGKGSSCWKFLLVWELGPGGVDSTWIPSSGGLDRGGVLCFFRFGFD